MDVLRLQAGSTLARHGPNVQGTGVQRRCQLNALRIVNIDHGGTQAGPLKQRQLGLPVGGHAAVVVQVVLGEIGEDGGVNARAIQPVLRQADGRGLNGAGLHTRLHKLPEVLLQQHRVGGGHAGGHQVRGGSGIACGLCRIRPGRPTNTQSTHQPARDSRCLL